MASRTRSMVIVGLALGAVGLAWGASQVPGRPAPPGPDVAAASASDATTPDASFAGTGAPDTGAEAGPAPLAAEEPAPPEVAPAAPRDVAANTARVSHGEIVEAPAREDYECLTPRIEIPREPACLTGAPYPECRWQVPGAHSSGDFYRIWRLTTPEHRWAQAGLVSRVLAAAREYAARWPGEVMTIGDLDAAGVRHQTHDRGHDVDLYLEHAMLESNIGGGHYLATYAGRPARVVRLLRAQVMDLGRILATCSGGRLRIYYNDPEVLVPFLAWFGERGMVSDVGPAMVEHNRLHRFHFHVTIADDMPPLPVAPPDAETGPE